MSDEAARYINLLMNEDMDDYIVVCFQRKERMKSKAGRNPPSHYCKHRNPEYLHY